jgi:predicted transcriptional regulator
MDFESEVISRNFLPAARTLLAEKLQDDYGLYQEEIAEEMEVTQPAVSKYLNKKRADEELLEKFKDDPQLMLLIDEAASKAAKGDKYTNEFRQILEAVKSKGLMSKKFNGTEKL